MLSNMDCHDCKLASASSLAHTKQMQIPGKRSQAGTIRSNCTYQGNDPKPELSEENANTSMSTVGNVPKPELSEENANMHVGIMGNDPKLEQSKETRKHVYGHYGKRSQAGTFRRNTQTCTWAVCLYLIPITQTYIT